MWPDWALYYTLGNFSKPVEKIILPKSPTFLANLCKVVKIFHFAREIILGNFLQFFTGHTGSAMNHSHLKGLSGKYDSQREMKTPICPIVKQIWLV